MRSRVYGVGEMVGVEEGYCSGIWLRGRDGVGRLCEVGCVGVGEVMVVLGVEDEWVCVVSSGGVIGWTWMNRLRVLGG